MRKSEAKKSVGDPVKEYASSEAGLAERAESLRKVHRPVVEANAQAAVRCASVLREVLRVRSKVAAALVATAAQVGRSSESAARGEFVPTREQFDIADKVFDLGVVDTRSASVVLDLFVGQVKVLHGAYEAAKADSPVVAFQVLRETSRALLNSGDEVSSAWRYVLAAWRTFSSEVRTIALFGTAPGAKLDEKNLRFDESTRTWKLYVGDVEPRSEG